MITKSAQDQNKFTKKLTFTRSARSAWRLIIASVEKTRGRSNILLPAYIGFTEREGSGIFDPVEKTKSEFAFYSLNQDLSIDREAFRTMAETGEFTIALVVHYFGFCRNDMDEIRRICTEHDIVLVEDCAHAFQLGLKTENLGTYGDFSFYSIHKHIATDSGGILKNGSRSIEMLPLPKEDEISLETALQLLNTDLDAVAKSRRDNFALYDSMMRGIEGVELMYRLDEVETPQTFPIRVKNNLREKMYFYLMEKNIPTIALYYRLIEKLSPKEYPQAHTISNEILNLPVHQDITKEDIAQIVKEVKSFLQAQT